MLYGGSRMSAPFANTIPAHVTVGFVEMVLISASAVAWSLRKSARVASPKALTTANLRFHRLGVVLRDADPMRTITALGGLRARLCCRGEALQRAEIRAIARGGSRRLRPERLVARLELLVSTRVKNVCDVGDICRAEWYRKSAMTITLKARVRGGRLILDEPIDLPEGSEIDLVPADQGDDLDDEDRARLHAALERSAQQYRNGEGILASDVLTRLGARDTE